MHSVVWHFSIVYSVLLCAACIWRLVVFTGETNAELETDKQSH